MKNGIKIALGLGGIAAVIGLFKLFAPKAKQPAPPPAGLGSLYGVVTDKTTSKPIPGVLVVADSASTQTDNIGYYEITNLTPGDYSVVFSKNGYNPVTC